MKKMTMLITGLKTAGEFPFIATLGVFLLLLLGSTAPALANEPPVYNGDLRDQRCRVGDSFSYTFPDNFWTDPDGDVITYEARQMDGSPLPTWFHFDAETRTFSCIGPSTVQNFIVEVIGSDPYGGSDSGYFRMTIAENTPPYYTGGLVDQYFIRSKEFSTEPFGETAFTDLDHDPLTLTATLADGSPLPYWIDFDTPYRYFYGFTPYDLGTHVIKVTATDPYGASDFGTFTINVVEVLPNRDPVYHDTLEPLVYETNTAYSYPLPINTFTDPDGDTLTYSGKLTNNFPLPGWIQVDPVTGEIYGTTPDYADWVDIKIIAEDGNGGSSYGTTSVRVVLPNSDPVYHDTLEPLVYEMGQAYSYTLPTNTFTDADGDILTYSGTLANDDPLPDWIHVNPVTGTISGTAPDYEDGVDIKIIADDGNGGSAYGTTSITIVSVSVNSPPQIDTIITDPQDPVGVSTLVCAGACFTDPDVGDTHTAGLDWGDGTMSEGNVDETEQSVTGCHTYSAAGVYTVGLTVTDAAGKSDSAQYKYIVVYDPDAGFVTGGGWINSPAGAYVYDASLSGKATFGFVSKYKKGATVPMGNTKFQFRAGDLNFHSTSYDWLVVTGSDYAKFKGTGDIDGFGSCRFQLWAGDGPDTFRIKLWTEDETGVEDVVYDNGSDQEISGGNITVHMN